MSEAETELPPFEPPNKIEKKLIPQPLLMLAKMEKRMAELTKLVEGSIHPSAVEDRQWASQACLKRYLRAEEGNVSKAHKRVIATIAWRKEQATIQSSSCSECEKDHRSHDLRCFGEDVYGRPIMYNSFAGCTARNPQGLLDHFILVGEECIRRMQSENVESWVWICDFEGFGMRDAVDPRFSIWLIQMLQNHYPERLGACVVIDAPKIFNVLWKAAKSVAASNTLRKCIFIYGEEARNTFADVLFGAGRGDDSAWLKEHLRFVRDKQALRAGWAEPHKRPPSFEPR